MKSKFHIIVAVACLAILTACGGGSKKSDPVVVPQPAYAIKDVTVGPGADTTTLAEKGDLVTVAYTGYLYDATKASTSYKGTKFDTSVGGTPLSYVVASGQLITGFDEGVKGMKVGGKRTVLIPASMGYGAKGQGSIPANANLVLDIELTAIK